MNRICLIGRLVSDPKITSYTKTETLRASGTIAVDGYKDKVDFIPFTAFGYCAEFLEKYFYKGQRIGMEGRISVQNYEDSNGDSRVYTCVIADHVYFADGKKEEEGNAKSHPNRNNNRRNK